MPISNSVIIEDSPQRDGRRYVREQHTDHLGRVFIIYYKALAGANITTSMNNRVGQIEVGLTEAELIENEQKALEGPFRSPSLQFCTANQARQRIRELYRQATAYTLARLAWYIQRLSLSDNQLKTLFGVDDAGLITLKARLATLEGRYNDLSNEVGS